MGLFPITIDDQIAEVEREIAMRRRVYPRWVGAGKIKQEDADERIEAMEAVLETLKRDKSELEGKKEPKPTPPPPREITEGKIP